LKKCHILPPKGLKTVYIIYIERKPTFPTLNNSFKQMTNNNFATNRPTAAQLQQNAAKAARKAAAQERRQDDYRQDAGFVAIYSA
jgi:hypothetical protein